MKKLTKGQKKEIKNFIGQNDICNMIIYLNSLNEKRDIISLKESFDYAKSYFWKKLRNNQNKTVYDVMGTAGLLYLDFDYAFENFVKSGNIRALQNVLYLGKLYGRYNCVKSIVDFGMLNNYDSLSLTREDYNSFIIRKTLPNIELERDNNTFFIREDILENALRDINENKSILGNVVRRMYNSGSLDSPRKLLLSLYSGDKELIEKSRDEFKKKLGIRKNIDLVVEELCEENNLKLIKKIQEGDCDDYYPLSANLYLIEKENNPLILKENIRYRIDFSCLNGYNMESELYSEILNHKSIPKFFGKLKKKGIEFILLECIKGNQLTEYTNKKNLLDKDEVVNIMFKLSKLLNYMHSNGIIYGDMKDKNIIYNEKDIKLIDYGMASTRIHKEIDTGEEFVNEVVSNAEYACPETIMTSRVYKKSDVFQLGILSYKLMTGMHPFAKGTATENYTERESELISFSLANLWNHPDFSDDTFVRNPHIKNIILDMLIKDYTKRPSTDQLLNRLGRIKPNLNEKGD